MTQVLAESFIQRAAAAVTGRSRSLYDDPTVALRPKLEERFASKRILIAGASGFIASQTLRQILTYRPKYVGLVDIAENGLAEVIRDLRSSDSIPSTTVVEPWLADISAPTLKYVAQSIGEVDQVMNFAAVKHVRSERDVPSLLRMLLVNVLGSYSVAKVFAEISPEAHYFVVSTDKAADPANFMGASKRAMELATLDATSTVNAARFANVAFSSGSLLESWLRRLANRQPLAVPDDTWRFFISPREAGQLCALATVAPEGRVVVPDLEDDSLVELREALLRTLECLELRPVYADSTSDALQMLAQGLEGEWPVVVTPRDTSGEKRSEVFVSSNESSTEWIPSLKLISIGEPTAAVRDLILSLQAWSLGSKAVTQEDLMERVQAAVPTFQHAYSRLRLDDRA